MVTCGVHQTPEDCVNILYSDFRVLAIMIEMLVGTIPRLPPTLYDGFLQTTEHYDNGRRLGAGSWKAGSSATPPQLNLDSRFDDNVYACEWGENDLSPGPWRWFTILFYGIKGFGAPWPDIIYLADQPLYRRSVGSNDGSMYRIWYAALKDLPKEAGTYKLSI